jgi:hypothetical protein
MEKLPSLHDVGSGFWNNFGTQAFVVRSSKRSDFQIDGLLSDLELQVPIDTPIYVGDIVEREDPRGGVLEYAVADVKFERDPFGHGDDYSNVILRDTSHLRAATTRCRRATAPRSRRTSTRMPPS